jgi:hypothetical protein
MGRKKPQNSLKIANYRQNQPEIVNASSNSPPLAFTVHKDLKVNFTLRDLMNYTQILPIAE